MMYAKSGEEFGSLDDDDCVTMWNKYGEASIIIFLFA